MHPFSLMYVGTEDAHLSPFLSLCIYGIQCIFLAARPCCVRYRSEHVEACKLWYPSNDLSTVLLL